MIRRTGKQSAAWLLATALLLQFFWIGFSAPMAAADEGGWVIYRPGVAQLKGNAVSLLESEDGVTANIPAGRAPNLFRDNMDLRIPDTLSMKDLALHMRLYVEDVSVMALGQIELSNSGADQSEIAWQLRGIDFVPGWNEIVLPLGKVTDYTGSARFDLHQPIRWFRLYSEIKSEAACSLTIGEVILTYAEGGARFGADDSYVELFQPLPQTPNTIEAAVKMDALATEWTISECDGTDGLYNSASSVALTPDTMPDGTPFMRLDIEDGGDLSLRYPSIGLTIPKAYAMEDLALSMMVYIDDIDHLMSGQIELTSDTSDCKELNWNPVKLGWKSGWNQVLLPLTEAHGQSGGTFDCHYINYFRWYFNDYTTAAMTMGIAQMKIVVLPEREEITEWTISDCDGTDGLYNSASSVALTPDTMPDGTPFMRLDIEDGGDLSLRYPSIGLTIPKAYAMEDLALSMMVYIDDIDHLMSGQIELTSDTSDCMELNWNPVKLGWKSGWNQVLLPLTEAHGQSGGAFDCHYINYFRWYFNDYTTAAMTMGIAQMKIVVLPKAPVVDCGPETHMIFSNTNSGDELPVALLVTADGHPSLIWGDRQVTFGCQVFTGEWVHLAVVRDMQQQAFILYVDGEEQERADASGTVDGQPTAVHRIGSDGAGVDGGIFNGLLGDIRAWSTVRTEQQIREHLVDMRRSRSNGLAADEEGLMGSWFLNEDIGDLFVTVRDGSRNANDGIVRGSRADDWLDYDKTEQAFLYDADGEEDYFTMVFIPDIQNLTTGRHTDLWYRMADWIAENTEAENIVHVIGAGDSTWNNMDHQYAIARSGFDRFADKVSWSNLIGNHDYVWYEGNKTSGQTVKNRDSAHYNRYFGLDYIRSTAAKDTFVSYMEDEYGVSRLENSYYTFGVNGIKYLVLQLEYYPRLSVLEWANEVLETHPDSNVILTTHGYLDEAGDSLTGSGGMDFTAHDSETGGELGRYRTLWNKVIYPHDNVKLVLCGHEFSDNVVVRQEENAAGNLVTQLMINAQELDETYFSDQGLGMLGVMRFSADGSQMALNYYAPGYDRSFRAANQRSFSFQMIEADCDHSQERYRVLEEASCTATGLREVYCRDCGLYLRTEDIPKLAHVPEVRGAKEASCQEEGYTGDTYCQVCGELLQRGEALPKLAHVPEVRGAKEASCQEEGYTGDTYCQVCGELLQRGEALPKLAHVPEVRGAKEASCREEGYTGDTYCQVCGELLRKGEAIPRTGLWGDADRDGKLTTTDARLVLQYSVGKITAEELTLGLADVDGDGVVNTTDARMILQKAVGKLPRFPVE